MNEDLEQRGQNKFVINSSRNTSALLSDFFSSRFFFFLLNQCKTLSKVLIKYCIIWKREKLQLG